MRPVSKDIEEVVKLMRDIESGPPYFYAGHRLSIGNILTNRSINNSQQSFPFVALRLGTPFTMVDGYPSYKLNILIATDTKKDIRETKRVDQKFIPTLYPLYDSFFKSLRDSGLFRWAGYQKMPDHIAAERFFLGVQGQEKNERNIFPEPIDAIEIMDLKIISTKRC